MVIFENLIKDKISNPVFIGRDGRDAYVSKQTEDHGHACIV